MFHKKFLQNGNYISWKRLVIEMLTQNCFPFAKKIRNIMFSYISLLDILLRRHLKLAFSIDSIKQDYSTPNSV